MSRLWLEHRWATGRDEEKESYERCAWKDEAGRSRDQGGPGREANELLNSAAQKHGRLQTHCCTGGSWGRCRIRQPPFPASQVPSVASPGASKPSTQKHFSAISQKTKPQALRLVFCARPCLLHTFPEAQTAAPAARSAASMGTTQLTCTAPAHLPPTARTQGWRRATTQHGSASPQSPCTEDPHCWGVKPSELGLNTPHCADSL